ncbi:hypothetical protein [Virgibacillus sp. MG-45]|uniref:hypothetical protein n=1 Tax=Virgibacillus sp. MG-45 TaxID=3102791 RepID=UPI002ED96502
MLEQPLQGAQEQLCINTEKVYDWVLLQTSINRNIAAADLGTLPIDPCATTVTNLSVDCFLVDDAGNPIPPNGEVPVTEVGERQNRTFNIDGTSVTLQSVNFTKTINVVFEFSGLDDTTPFVEQSDPISIIVPESSFLCAPEGTELSVRITEVDCGASANCIAGALDSVDLALTICQSVQTVTNVTLELTADFCQPREQIFEQCPTPAIPPQCPVLFPGG